MANSTSPSPAVPQESAVAAEARRDEVERLVRPLFRRPPRSRHDCWFTS